MTCTLHAFPTTPAIFARLSERDDQPYARYDAAKRGLLSAGNDWPRMLGYAETLASSPRPTDTELAQRTRAAYSRHLRDAAQETSARIALRHLPRWPALLAGAVAFTGFWWGVVALVMGVGG